jgi:hypothetical protein
MYALARLILRDADRAQDAVQDALIEAWRDLPGLRDPDRLDAWLHGLLVRSCYRLAERERRRRIIEIPLAFDHDRPTLDGLVSRPRGARVRAAAVILMATSVVMTACASNESPSAMPTSASTAELPAPTSVGPEPSAASADAVLVAIGDSIPYNAEEDCPACTGFGDSYGAALEARIGQPVGVQNR